MPVRHPPDPTMPKRQVHVSMKVSIMTDGPGGMDFHQSVNTPGYGNEHNMEVTYGGYPLNSVTFEGFEHPPNQMITWPEGASAHTQTEPIVQMPADTSKDSDHGTINEPRFKKHTDNNSKHHQHKHNHHKHHKRSKSSDTRSQCSSKSAVKSDLNASVSARSEKHSSSGSVPSEKHSHRSRHKSEDVVSSRKSRSRPNSVHNYGEMSQILPPRFQTPNIVPYVEEDHAKRYAERHAPMRALNIQRLAPYTTEDADFLRQFPSKFLNHNPKYEFPSSNRSSIAPRIVINTFEDERVRYTVETRKPLFAAENLPLQEILNRSDSMEHIGSEETSSTTTKSSKSKASTQHAESVEMGIQCCGVPRPQSTQTDELSLPKSSSSPAFAMPNIMSVLDPIVKLTEQLAIANSLKDRLVITEKSETEVTTRRETILTDPAGYQSPSSDNQELEVFKRQTRIISPIDKHIPLETLINDVGVESKEMQTVPEKITMGTSMDTVQYASVQASLDSSVSSGKGNSYRYVPHETLIDDVGLESKSIQTVPERVSFGIGTENLPPDVLPKSFLSNFENFLKTDNLSKIFNPNDKGAADHDSRGIPENQPFSSREPKIHYGFNLQDVSESSPEIPTNEQPQYTHSTVFESVTEESTIQFLPKPNASQQQLPERCTTEQPKLPISVLLSNQPTMLLNQPITLQNQPNLLQNLQNPPTILQNQPFMLRNQPVILQNQQNVLQNQPCMLQNQPTVHQNQPVMLQNQPTVHQNQPVMLQNQPTLLPNPHTKYCVSILPKQNSVRTAVQPAANFPPFINQTTSNNDLPIYFVRAINPNSVPVQEVMLKPVLPQAPVIQQLAPPIQPPAPMVQPQVSSFIPTRIINIVKLPEVMPKPSIVTQVPVVKLPEVMPKPVFPQTPVSQHHVNPPQAIVNYNEEPKPMVRITKETNVDDILALSENQFSHATNDRPKSVENYAYESETPHESFEHDSDVSSEKTFSGSSEQSGSRKQKMTDATSQTTDTNTNTTKKVDHRFVHFDSYSKESFVNRFSPTDDSNVKLNGESPFQEKSAEIPKSINVTYSQPKMSLEQMLQNRIKNNAQTPSPVESKPPIGTKPKTEICFTATVSLANRPMSPPPPPPPPSVISKVRVCQNTQTNNELKQNMSEFPVDYNDDVLSINTSSYDSYEKREFVVKHRLLPSTKIFEMHSKNPSVMQYNKSPRSSFDDPYNRGGTYKTIMEESDEQQSIISERSSLSGRFDKRGAYRVSDVNDIQKSEALSDYNENPLMQSNSGTTFNSNKESKSENSVFSMTSLTKDKAHPFYDDGKMSAASNKSTYNTSTAQSISPRSIDSERSSLSGAIQKGAYNINDAEEYIDENSSDYQDQLISPYGGRSATEASNYTSGRDSMTPNSLASVTSLKNDNIPEMYSSKTGKNYQSSERSFAEIIGENRYYGNQKSATGSRTLSTNSIDREGSGIFGIMPDRPLSAEKRQESTSTLQEENFKDYDQGRISPMDRNDHYGSRTSTLTTSSYYGDYAVENSRSAAIVNRPSSNLSSRGIYQGTGVENKLAAGQEPTVKKKVTIVDSPPVEYPITDSSSSSVIGSSRWPYVQTDL